MANTKHHLTLSLLACLLCTDTSRGDEPANTTDAVPPLVVKSESTKLSQKNSRTRSIQSWFMRGEKKALFQVTTSCKNSGKTLQNHYFFSSMELGLRIKGASHSHVGFRGAGESYGSVSNTGTEGFFQLVTNQTLSNERFSNECLRQTSPSEYELLDGVEYRAFLNDGIESLVNKTLGETFSAETANDPVISEKKHMRGNELRCLETTYRNAKRGLWKRYDFYAITGDLNDVWLRWSIQEQNGLSLMVAKSDNVSFSDIGSDGSYEWLDLDSQDATGKIPRYELFNVRDPWNIKLSSNQQRSAFSKDEIRFLGGTFAPAVSRWHL